MNLCKQLLWNMRNWKGCHSRFADLITFPFFSPFGWISCRHFPLTFNGNHLISFTSDMKTLNMVKWMKKKMFARTQKKNKEIIIIFHDITFSIDERRTHFLFLLLWFMIYGNRIQANHEIQKEKENNIVYGTFYDNLLITWGI